MKIILTSALLMGSAHAFVGPSSSPITGSRTPAGTLLRMSSNDPTSTGFDSFSSFKRNEAAKAMPYGEASRKFRRTVYSHDDWKKHRSPDRFFFYVTAIFKSGVYRNLLREVAATVAVASFIVVWNAYVGGYTDFNGIPHEAVINVGFLPKLTLPLTPFTLASPSLGLLLVFRTNTSYGRWDEARKNWGSNINRTRDLNRMANAYYDSTGVSDEQREDDLKTVALCTWAFVRAMKRHLSPEEEDEAAFKAELYEKLPQRQAEMIIAAAHRPNRALQDLSNSIEDLPMHFMRKNQIHGDLTQFEDNLGSSERLLTSPVPVFYTRHLARFLAVWLLLLPFALYDPMKFTWNSIGLIPATAIISVFLFGIEELATQLEEPFTILPMQAFCDKIYNWCMEISTWSPGDYGRPMKPIKAQHEFFAQVGIESGEAPVAHNVPPPVVVEQTVVAATPPPPPPVTPSYQSSFDQPPPPPSSTNGGLGNYLDQLGP
mmetsp:Transcript_30041/g.82479  ORF Transcript_30041/g.82479 Transcript_30041/m.82479 type:complete len:487 (-) Transcript_30041:296-1756(-)|eukprot:CAMPEP_0168737166 /NCGR_PEP_ID=MMETSP0724-20121128/10245_1 /TAXON_ID=265536 /ORGANISM="Amphiprora sp., Strain CCMP467" /LENGTH=486 /DNA_ID=CAMNT_0008784405 /DNA_START=83 /DNA_END=1543 /DNA_ORIENTATION=-